MPIAAELRPDWKISTLLLILQISSYGGKSSLKRLHVLNWAIPLSPVWRRIQGGKGEPTAPIWIQCPLRASIFTGHRSGSSRTIGLMGRW